MPEFLRAIRKKRNRTNFLVVFFMFCTVLEVLSHAQTGTRIVTADLTPSESKVCAAKQISGNADEDKQGTELSCSEKKDEDHPLNGVDELNHHHVLIVTYSYKVKMLKSRAEKIISEPADPMFSALSPPYLPPELS
jgi:hypothetical protein